ncbi:MAG: ABC transporter permease [Gemmatimonadales bacterium]
MLGRLWRRLRQWLGRRRFEDELREELAFHLESKASDLVDSGLSGAEAARQAKLRLGRASAVMEEAREAWTVRWMDTAARELGQALRSLRRTPGFTVVAALTLGLGIGGTAALGSLLDAALFKPLPYHDADRLVTLNTVPPSGGDESNNLFPWSYPIYRTLHATATSYDGIAGYDVTNLNVGQGGDAERLVAEEVSSQYFALLGIAPILGRSFSAAVDSTPGGGGELILGHALWLRRFGADSAIVGKTVTVHGQPLTVVGVMPRGFTGLTLSAELWVPLTSASLFAYSSILEEGGNFWLSVVARLAPEVQRSAAQAELEVITSRIGDEFREPPQGVWGGRVTALTESRIEPGIRRTIVVLGVAVGLVLLIGCANLVNLFLARAAGRRREMAVRLAVGAGSRHLMRQLTVESLVLAFLGAGVGLLLARVALPALLGLAPAGGVGLVDLRAATIDGRIVALTMALAVLAGLLVAVGPALRSRRVGVQDAVGGVSFASRSEAPSRVTFQRVLVAFETALALLLLTGAGLLVQSLVRLQRVDLGFTPRNVLGFQVSPSDQDLSARDPVRAKAQVIEELRTIPGVREVGAATCLPLGGRCMGSVVTPDPTMARPDERVSIGVHYVTPGFFTALGVRLVEGRWFDESDREGSRRVVVINETAAKRLWPGQSPIGKRLAAYTVYFAGGDSTAEIIGLVGDVRFHASQAEPGADLYAPALQVSFGFTSYLLATEGDPLLLVEPVRRAVNRVDPNLPIYDVRTMAEREAVATVRTRFATFLLLVFAGLGVLLAAVGVYGVMAYAVAGRTRELGIRLALGAEPRRLRRMVLGEAALTAGIGSAVGLAAAFGATRLLSSLLYQVDARDPFVLTAATAVVLLVAVASAYLPAARAAATDPVLTIREE